LLPTVAGELPQIEMCFKIIAVIVGLIQRYYFSIRHLDQLIRDLSVNIPISETSIYLRN